MSAVDSGPDALGEVTVLLELDGVDVVGPGRVHGHPRGVGARVPARALERGRELRRGRGRAPPRSRRDARAGQRAHALSERDFRWIDGERLIRFAGGAAARGARAPALARVRGLCAAHDRSLPLHAAGGGGRCGRRRPVRPGGRGFRRDPRRGGRPPGGGARRRPGDRFGQGDRCCRRSSLVAALPTTLSGAEVTPFHRLPEGVEGKALVRPSLVIADPAADGVRRRCRSWPPPP